jgi:chlorite dismutase
VEVPVLDIGEKGMDTLRNVIRTDARMYVQFLSFTDVLDVELLVRELEAFQGKVALYLDLNDPRGVGMVCMHEDPTFFVTTYRALLATKPFAALTAKPHLTMTGRTYTIGYEADFDEALFDRPASRILNPELEWVIWYPLRRRGSFETLSKEEQREIMKEHGSIGHQFGSAGIAYDVRLNCHGLDENDNDFLIGILGNKLAPLSKVVEHMRKTKQTSQYLEKLGPFFVGKVHWQSTYVPRKSEK